MSHLLFFILLFTSLQLFSQKKWDGGGGNDQWNNPLNWNNDIVPSSTDEVILDNSVITGNYSVILPNEPVTVKTILIDPGSGHQIQLILPQENTVVPGLTITSPGYGLVINKGGTFKNSSGASSGAPLSVADSIRINNDGRFIINTPRAHATNVDRLSQLPGTEKGIVEFDVPDASTTISLSGRTYGKLVLSSTALGAPLNYTAAGIMKVIIRSDLKIGEGVNFNLNFSDSIIIKENLLQDGGVFNLGNTSRNVVVAVAGNIIQAAGGVITETGTGIQQLLLNGNIEQQIDIEGQIINQVGLTKNGSGNARLLSDLQLPYLLQLDRGNIITAAANMLILQTGCNIRADSLGDSFVDGPLQKEGAAGENFLFPVGKSGKLRWLELLSATGDFTVEYFSADPKNISNNYGTGIDHISGIEYWNIGTANTSSAIIKLSFDDPNSGGVTDLSQLHVARLQGTIWQNAGNTDFRGAPGSDGWVSSFAASGFSAETNLFALASAVGQENPLPVFFHSFEIARSDNKILFKWKVDRSHTAGQFELQYSNDNLHYKIIYTCNALEGISDYSYQLKGTVATQNYYRIKATDKNGSTRYFSKTIFLNENLSTITMNTITVSNSLNLRVMMNRNKNVEIVIYDALGHLQKKLQMNLPKGTTNLTIPINDLSRGTYTFRMLCDNEKLASFRFIR